MNKRENRATLLWVEEMITQCEAKKSHSRIVIDIRDGICHNTERSDKVLVDKLPYNLHTEIKG
jgi:hypothetical protein